MNGTWRWLAWLWLASSVARADGVAVTAVGDVLLARAVATRYREHGAAWFWERIARPLAAADLRFANLECAVTRIGEPVPKRFSFRADPAMARAVLAAGRLDLVSVANNHAWDYGRVGLMQTLRHLAAGGVLAAGAGLGRSGAAAPTIVERHGLRLGLVAYTAWPPDDEPQENAVELAVLAPETLAAELAAARRQVDALVVSVHWGVEYSPHPTDEQRRLGRAMIDAGADAVFGHHPHVAQPIEWYAGRPICYSLGNAVFDRTGETVSGGLLVTARFRQESVTLERILRLRIDDARPRPAGAEGGAP